MKDLPQRLNENDVVVKNLLHNKFRPLSNDLVDSRVQQNQLQRISTLHQNVERSTR
jgi:hypothetical protein